MTPNVSGDFGVDVQFAGQGLADSAVCEQTSIHFSVYDSSHRLLFEDSIPSVIAAEQAFRGTVKNVRLWGPNEPNLYTLEVHLQGAVTYRKRVRFGFRKFRGLWFFSTPQPVNLLPLVTGHSSLVASS